MSGSRSTSYKDIQVAEFEDLMQLDDAVIVDVRTPKETASGVIDGAIELDIKSRTFMAGLQALDTSKTYLLYCRSGRRSAHAGKIMARNGFSKIYNLKGGYQAWKRKHTR